MVCLGNICRSPMAEGILKNMVKKHDLNWEVDSAGTGDWHIGEPPHIDSINEAKKNGLDLTDQRARQLSSEDFHYFDLILVMDDQNLANAGRIAPEGTAHKLRKLLSFHPDESLHNLPDPYFEGGFDSVFSMIKESCRHIIKTYN